MKPVYTKEEECIGDIKRKYIRHPHFQAHVRMSASEAAGDSALSFYRGRHAGIHDAYRTLRKEFPKAAKALLKAYGMDEKGSIHL